MSDIEKIILGASLAIFGGIIGKFISVYIDEWRERKFIKRGLCDELKEISVLLHDFSVTYNSSNQLIPTFLTQLKENMESYQATRGRLYLIWRASRRTAIMVFYRDLQKHIADHEGKLGNLSTPQQKTPASDAVAAKFNALKTRADDLVKTLTPFM